MERTVCIACPLSPLATLCVAVFLLFSCANARTGTEETCLADTIDLDGAEVVEHVVGEGLLRTSSACGRELAHLDAGSNPVLFLLKPLPR